MSRPYIEPLAARWSPGVDEAAQQAALGREIGGKAAALARLGAAGFNVPAAYVVDCRGFADSIEASGLREPIACVLAEERFDALPELLQRLRLAPGLAAELEELPDGRYAVRSSGVLEDLADSSFAGQYASYLRREPESIGEAILDCYRSLYGEGILRYCLDRGLDLEQLQMAVIIQDMVEADCSGVAFTVDPVSGADTEIVAELTQGTAEDLVSGRVSAARYRYDWYEGRYLETPEGLAFSEAQAETLWQRCLEVQMHVGYPCDIEFAFRGEEFYLLQSRPITHLRYEGFESLWSNADFKDGGVSSTVCTPFMWSLYEYVWQERLSRFMVDSHIATPEEVDRPLGEMFYGRPYWNLSVVKTAMSHIPGYIERDFDMEYGVRIHYEGDGERTGFRPRALLHVLRIALAQRRILREHRSTVEAFRDAQLRRYEADRAALEEPMDGPELKRRWIELTRETI